MEKFLITYLIFFHSFAINSTSNNLDMKNKENKQKKLSLNKLQLAKINNPKSIKGGGDPDNTWNNTKTNPTTDTK